MGVSFFLLQNFDRKQICAKKFVRNSSSKLFLLVDLMAMKNCNERRKTYIFLTINDSLDDSMFPF